MLLRRKEKHYIYNANNHVLSTIFTWFFTNFLGYSEIVLRIPALIGCFLYLLGTYKISNLICKKNFFQPISVIILTFNPMLLDFFSLCRGYSLALGFMMLGIYFFFRTLLNIGSIMKNNFYCFLMLTLATTSIMTFISSFLAIISILSLLEYTRSLLKNGKNFNSIKKISLYKHFFFFIQKVKKNILIPLVPNIVIISCLVLFFILPTYTRGKFDYGSENFVEFINSLIICSTYNKNLSILKNSDLFIIFYFFIIISIIIIIITLISITNLIFLKKQKLDLKFVPLLGAIALLFFSIFFIYIQYFTQCVFNLFYNKEIIGYFPLDRTGIFLIPIYFLLIVTSWKSILDEIIKILKNKSIKQIKKSSVIGVSLSQFFYVFFFIFLISNGFNNLNFTHTYFWKSNASLKIVINDLTILNPDKEDLDVYFDIVYFGRIPYYYKKLYDLDWIKINKESNISVYDYCVLLKSNLNKIENLNSTKIKYYSISEIYLIEIE